MKINNINRNSKTKKPGIKGFFYWWLENDNNPKEWILSLLLNLIIIVSIIFTIIDLSSESTIPKWHETINDIFLAFFIIEYLTRFSISTDFIYDVKKENGSLWIAIKNKIRWMFKFFSLIDLLSILPAIRFLRIFRTIRLIRLIRLIRFLRILRVLKLFRNLNNFMILLKSSFVQQSLNIATL